MVSFELIVTLPASSCSAPPNDQRIARMAMLVCSSCASPTPQGCPLLSRIFFPPTRKSSYVSGPLGYPASVHQSLCQFPGSGVYASEKAKYLFVFGLYVDLCASSIFFPCFFSTS